MLSRSRAAWARGIAVPRLAGTSVAMGSWSMKSCARRPGNRDLVLSLVRRWGGAALAASSVSSSEAAAPSDEPAKHPTDLGSLIELRNDYTRKGEAVTNAGVLHGEYAARPWISLRVEVPFVYVDTPKSGSAFGVGDVSARATARLAAFEVSLLAGADFLFDSAASPELGAGKNVIGPFATVAWDLGPGVWVRVQVQQLASFGGDSRRPAVSATSVRPYALVSLPEGFWLMVDQKLQVYQAGNQRLGYTAVFEAGKELTNEVSMYVDPGVELDSPWALAWLMSAGIRWTAPR
jgi:hypothetical protein